MNNEIWLVIFLLVLAFVTIILSPLVTIWSLNTVFGLEIVYSFKTWVAIAWLITIIHGAKYNKNRQND